MHKALKGSGPTEGVAISESDLEAAKDNYYDLAGYDKKGNVTSAKLEELGLAWLT